MSVLSSMTVASVINGAAVVKKGDDPTSTLVAAGAFTLVLLYVQDNVDPKLASTLAGIFLLGTFMIHYQVFLDLIDYFTTPVTKEK